MLDFYDQLIYASLAFAAIVIIIRQECMKNFEKIEGNLGNEWFLIQSHIWSNDVKNTVKDLSGFVNEGQIFFKKRGSNDPLTDVFSETSQVRILTSRLNELTKSFNAYNSFNNILSEYSTKNNILKKWIEFSLIGSGLLTIWSFIGIYLEFKLPESIYNTYLWYFFPILLLVFLAIIIKAVTAYLDVEGIKSQIRNEKSKHSEVIQVPKHV
jgi:hypothetical protein